jgi:uncharacterized SAM-binding protein YcdF (DUF218 family)
MNKPFYSSKWATLLGFILLAGIVLFNLRYQILLSLGDYLIIEDRLHPADVLHVIAGENYRTDYAIQLFKRGNAKILFFTGGWCKQHGYYHGEHAKARSMAQGVPPNSIVFDDSTVISTYQETERLKEWMGRSRTVVHSVTVVSDPFHMRRARWTCERLLGKSVAVQMAPVPFELTPYRRNWWADRLSRSYVKDEYKKLVYYVLRYQISSGKFQEWLASRDQK